MSEAMHAASDAYATISDKIRALHAAGFPRSSIARFLQRHPTQVRNVIKADEIRGRAPVPRKTLAQTAPPPLESAAPPVDGATGDRLRLTMQADGSLLLPQALRESFDLAAGDTVMAEVVGETLVIPSRAEMLRRVQASVRRHVPEGVSLVDELIVERRRENARDGREG